MKKVLIIMLSLLFWITCEDEKEEPKVEYLDLQWIWLGEKSTYDCAEVVWCDTIQYPGVHRDARIFYRGDRPEIPNSFFNNDVNWVTYYSYKSKWVYYYKDDSYIEYQKIGSDNLDSYDVSDYIIEYKER